MRFDNAVYEDAHVCALLREYILEGERAGQS